MPPVAGSLGLIGATLPEVSPSARCYDADTVCAMRHAGEAVRARVPRAVREQEMLDVAERAFARARLRGRVDAGDRRAAAASRSRWSTPTSARRRASTSPVSSVRAATCTTAVVRAVGRRRIARRAALARDACLLRLGRGEPGVLPRALRPGKRARRGARRRAAPRCGRRPGRADRRGCSAESMSERRAATPTVADLEPTAHALVGAAEIAGRLVARRPTSRRSGSRGGS